MSVPKDVGATSLIVAYARAQETRRPDAIFLDRWAEVAVRAATAQPEGPLPRMGFAREDDPSPFWRDFTTYLAMRTVFYDEHILKAYADGVRQVVLLAAGLDARACRLGLPPDTTVFEVDHADVLAFKEQILATVGEPTTCPRVVVAADLREDWLAKLTDAGFRPGLPAVFVAEGLLMYFTPEQSDDLLREITAASAPGSRFLSEYPARQPTEDFLLSRCADDIDRAAAAGLSALLKSGPAVEPSGWLTGYGWKPEVTDVASLVAELGRPVPAMVGDAPDAITVWLLAGSRG
ncbi:SAM-dependent methyltransferase [Catenuloplanes atrovinosus]|uniref:S-adenosyl-L-methionine-dependent methyltransferase n=1 Tax=Catenuloplanes atrovinosus TaxID=137266 RepID=A0AAE3YPJ2_9ACTN|nr:SAM-dependent methyltransferase [Catenuloplanes atrovinosus]MDR7277310.1 methyltransferase (TIGR00027 family) [Catenuloplanes atrovinosus]